MIKPVLLCFLWLLPLTIAAPVDFVSEVQPIFERHCVECHGPDRQKSGLRLDVKAAALKGGDQHAPDIIPGEGKASPLIRFVASAEVDERMPPKGSRLSAAEIATLTRWVDEGAIWPERMDRVPRPDRRDHWAFQPIGRPIPPPVKDEQWARNDLDRFILARLETEGLPPAQETDRVSWLRRVCFDLIGLPPTPEQVAAFIQDARVDAYERVVEKLLASPRYGERWAQHWLDVVRYADTHGFEVNTERPNAWPYRDYVIRAFNQDRPYDRFISEQIVGDALGEDAATGFLITASVLLPGQIGQDEPSKRLARQDALDEIVVNITHTFLGLGVGCARCHDHKFDPISQRDYYAMQSFVSGVEYEERELRTPEADRLRAEQRALRKQLAQIEGDLAQLASLAQGRANTLDSSQGLTPDDAIEVTCLIGERKAIEARIKQMDSGQKAFAGLFRKPDVIHRLNRGDPEQPKEELTPAVLSALDTVTLPKNTPEQQRRKALAEWIASPRNPVTARVMVNRTWQDHFGTGLVETPSDFGLNGARPSHPELLDWLAVEFLRSGWSVKQMHRLIVLSATYRQSSQIHPAALARDAEDRLLWRYPSRRLEAETIRDSILAVSGSLNLAMGGRGFDLFDQRGGLSGFKPVESYSGEGLRRMVYAHKVRREREAVFGAFDCPDAGQSTAHRRESTTPIQALNLFNSRFVIDQSAAFSARVMHAAGEDSGDQIRLAWQFALARAPTAEELADAQPVVLAHGLATVCRALFNSNEFLFLP